MVTSVGREEVRRLLDKGARVVEVLEETQFRAAHLPGAIHLPAWELTRDRVEAALDRDRPVVVYCFDTL
jgi:rhodanese-related sulfurtransferase